MKVVKHGSDPGKENYWVNRISCIKIQGNLGFSVGRMGLRCSRNWDYWKSVSVPVKTLCSKHQAIWLSLFSPYLSISFWPLFTSRRYQLQLSTLSCTRCSLRDQHFILLNATSESSWCILKMWFEQHRSQHLISCYHSAAAHLFVLVFVWDLVLPECDWGIHYWRQNLCLFHTPSINLPTFSLPKQYWLDCAIVAE